MWVAWPDPTWWVVDGLVKAIVPENDAENGTCPLSAPA